MVSFYTNNLSPSSINTLKREPLQASNPSAGLTSNTLSPGTTQPRFAGKDDLASVDPASKKCLQIAKRQMPDWIYMPNESTGAGRPVFKEPATGALRSFNPAEGSNGIWSPYNALPIVETKGNNSFVKRLRNFWHKF